VRRCRPLHTSVAWLECSWFARYSSAIDRFSRPPRPHHHNPVLLIHGIWDTEQKMEPMARFLRARDWEVHTMNLHPSDGQVPLDVLARQIEAETLRLFPAGGSSISWPSAMGGNRQPLLFATLGGYRRVFHFVTLSAPHPRHALGNPCLKSGLQAIATR